MAKKKRRVAKRRVRRNPVSAARLRAAKRAAKRRVRRNPQTAAQKKAAAKEREAIARAELKLEMQSQKEFAADKAKRKAAAAKAAKTRAANKAKKIAAAQKAAKTRAANKAAGKKPKPKKPKSAAPKRISAKVRRSRLRAKIKRLSASIQKAPKRSPKRAIGRARLGALRVQAAAMRKKSPLSAAQKTALKKYGLTRVNPSLKAVATDFVGLLPEMAVGVAATAGVAWLGQKAGDKLAGMSWMPEAVKPHAQAVSTAGVAMAAYAAAKMVRPMQKFSLPILVGGMSAVVVHILAAPRASGQSLGRQIGLPLGEYAAIDGFGEYAAIDGFGEYAAIDGFGEYIPQSLGAHYGEHLGEVEDYLDVDGAMVRLNGSIFDESSLGAAQMGLGREPARALGAEGDMTVEEVLAEADADSGVLSGSIFD